MEEKQFIITRQTSWDQAEWQKMCSQKMTQR